MKILVALVSLCVASASYSAEVVTVCNLGAKTSLRVELIRDSKIASTHIYYVRQAGKRTPLFGAAELSRGSDVVAQCVGTRQRALILSGEFTANAVQGVVFVSRPHPTGYGRLDFAEKGRPRWLYLGVNRLIVIVPTLGVGERSAKYTLYRHVLAGAVEDQIEQADELPPDQGFEVIELK